MRTSTSPAATIGSEISTKRNVFGATNWTALIVIASLTRKGGGTKIVRGGEPSRGWSGLRRSQEVAHLQGQIQVPVLERRRVRRHAVWALLHPRGGCILRRWLRDLDHAVLHEVRWR